MNTHPILITLLALALILAGCASPSSTSGQPLGAAYWPTSGWRTATPESQGMDSALLAQMLEKISADQTAIHSVLVVRNGYLVTEAYFHPYTAEVKEHIQSVTKSVIGALVGIAIRKGEIRSLDENLVDFFKNRPISNLSQEKNLIQIRHLLSMSSGLDCQEFSGEGPRMEQTRDWVQFVLDLPVVETPGKKFGYCNGNAHLLSAILEKSTGLDTRKYADQELFGPLGIPAVGETSWGADPQGFATGGYGVHLRPLDLAKFALLYLKDGQWEGRQILPEGWVAASTTQHVQKEDGSGYGYLWTVYPQAGHYAALGLGGQQVHVYPDKNLLVVVTAGLESTAEAPEIESMLDSYILPAIQSDATLADNPGGVERLRTAIARAAHPIQPVAELPARALDITGSTYTFGENPLGIQTMELVFTPSASSAELLLNNTRKLQVGLDNLFRLSSQEPFGEILLRGHWEDDHTLVIDYPYPLIGYTQLGELGNSEFRFRYDADRVEVTARQLIFGGQPVVFTGSR